MNKFYVGQRVRIVCARSIHIGATATVTMEKRDAPLWHMGERRHVPVLYRVDVDGHGERTIAGRWRAYEPSDLAPIGDSRDIASWSACVWQPSSVKERA